MLFLALMIFLMGVAHVALTPVTYGAFTLDALWFAGSGVALIILALLQFVLLEAEKRSLLFIQGHLSNALAVILVALILTIVFQPHILFLFCLLLAQTCLFIAYHLKMGRA